MAQRAGVAKNAAGAAGSAALKNMCIMEDITRSVIESVPIPVTVKMRSGWELDNIISVGAINENGRLTSWSNYGSKSVDLAAPGDGIYSTSSESDTGYLVLSGTSMACPHVSGVAALMLAQNKKIAPTALKALLIRSVSPATSLKGRVASGGWINAFNALSLGKPVPKPPGQGGKPPRRGERPPPQGGGPGGGPPRRFLK